MAKFFAHELAIEFYQLTKDLKLPSHLRNQYLRACSSVVMNLAEGSAKPTVADRRKFYYIALGSFRECQVVLNLHRVGSDVILKKADFLGICIFRLCRSL